MANEPRLPNGLTPKQFNFYNNIIEQMKTTGQMNPSQAAIDAGFAPKHVSKMASSLLKKPAGQAYLKSLQKNSICSAEATIDWVMERLTRIANLSLPHYEKIRADKKGYFEYRDFTVIPEK
jgi:phage terminase small subunit